MCAAKTCSVFRQHDFMHLIADDTDLASMVVDSFLRDTENRLYTLELALRGRQWDEVVLDAHAIKGAAANLCADELFEAARTLEHEARNRRVIASICALETVAEAHRHLHERVQRLLITHTNDRAA